jgi:transmembrane sensor
MQLKHGMKKPDKKLLNKYFNGTATRSEAEKVLDWFQTAEGNRYIEKQFSADIKSDLIIDDPETTRERNEEVLQAITDNISRNEYKSLSKSISERRHRNSYKFVAISILVMISMMYIMNLSLYQGKVFETITYQTGTSEIKSIELSDGSVIRLNENSSLTIASGSGGDMSANLSGQAYFDIVSNTDRRFEVLTSESIISVLGTSFDVNTLRATGNVTVAVSEGKVTFRSNSVASEKILTENMVGYYEKMSGNIYEERTDIYNYLSWLHGNIVFNNTPIDQVLHQLERIFDITNELDDSELSSLRLTANFNRGSLENVLNTISEGLNINYTINNGIVRWSSKHTN